MTIIAKATWRLFSFAESVSGNKFKQQIVKNAVDAELAAERAVMAKERELQTELRAADRENAKLQAKID